MRQIEYSNFQHRTGELRGLPETCPAHIRALIVENRAADARKRGIVVEPVVPATPNVSCSELGELAATLNLLGVR
jgi:hypothetical protein